MKYYIDGQICLTIGPEEGQNDEDTQWIRPL